MVRKGFPLRTKILKNTQKTGGEAETGGKFSVSVSEQLLLLLAGAMLTGFTLIFPKLGFLEWLTLSPAAYVLLGAVKNQNITLKRAYLYGLFFFMSFYVVIYHWFLYLYPLEFTGMSRGAAAVVVIAGWFGLSFLQALAGGLIFPLAVLTGRTRTVRSHGLVFPFLAASLWVIFEWSQTLFWSGVPWARLAIGQTDMPVMFQTASLFGSYFITYLVTAVNFLAAYAFYDRKSKKVKFCALSAAGLVLFNAVAGGIILLSTSGKSGKEINAAVIQANIGSGDKWDMKVSDMLDIYSDYSIKAALSKPDIIIWPETSMPITLEENPITVGRIKRLAAECKTPILVGIFTEDENGNEYNSMVLFNPDGTIGEQVYSKRHLVPFGEYLPLRNIIAELIPPLAQVAMLDEDLTPGSGSGIIECNGVKYGSLICFDSIYEQLTRDSVLDGAEVIVICTNDSWFYDSAAGRMHNAQAKLRAVESGRYVLRAANTGISSVITPNGKVTDQLEPLKAGYIVAKVGVKNSSTLYTIIGNAFVAVCCLFCILPAAFSLAYRILGKKHIALTISEKLNLRRKK